MAPPSAIDIEAVRDTEAIVLPNPLTINGVSGRRLKAGKLVAGTAAYTSSDFFKSPVSSVLPSMDLLLTLAGHRKAQSKKMGSYAAHPHSLNIDSHSQTISASRAKLESLLALKAPRSSSRIQASSHWVEVSHAQKTSPSKKSPLSSPSHPTFPNKRQEKRVKW